MNYYLGLDVGTTNIKAAVFNLEGELLAYHSVPNVVHQPAPEESIFEPEEIWGSVCACIRNVAEKVGPENIKAVAASSMAECGVLTDEEGTPLYPIITWYDGRTLPQMEQLGELIGARKIYSITGQVLATKYSLCKMMWIKEHHPEVMEKAKHWMCVQDYVIYRLSGEFATDYSTAGRTLCFDLNTMDWSSELMGAVGLSTELMGRPVPGGTKVGEVNETGSLATGLLPGTAVVTGGHDHCCAAIGVNIFEDGAVMDSMGTSETMMAAAGKAALNDEAFENRYAVYPHCGPKVFRVLSSSQACGVTIEWLFRTLGADLAEKAELEGNTKFNQLEKVAAGRNGTGLYFMPMLRGCLDVPYSKGVFWNLTDAHDRGDMINAAINGLCYEVKKHLEDYSHLLGQKYDRLRVVGGISKSDYIMQRKADINGRKIEVPVIGEAACFGAALLSAIGCGDLTFEELGRYYNCDRSYESHPERIPREDYEEFKALREDILEVYRKHRKR